jgi:hypothetical protein
VDKIHVKIFDIQTDCVNGGTLFVPVDTFGDLYLKLQEVENLSDLLVLTSKKF